MDDDEVVFQNSALHQHLKSVGYTDEDVDPELQVMELPSDQSQQEWDEANEKESKSFLSKLTFWTKLKNSINDAFWNETWNDQLTQVHNKYADEITDAILQNPVLEEEDGTYIESFYASMQSYRPENTPGESSIMGVMLMQMAILSVSLAYAGFRMIYLKSPDITSRYYVWSIDVIAVLLTIAVLTPTTVRSASAGKALGRLKEFSKTAHNFLKETHTFYHLTRKSVKLVQEMELVVRGFTIISSITPVTRLEQGKLQSSRRQCPKLRRLTFHASRALMLNVKRAAQNLLKSFPPHVEIDGLSSYLANQPLHQYGPCVYTSGDDTEDKLRAVTDDYSLASIKAMVELSNIHMSEFLRILAMSCLTQAEEHDKNPSYKTQKQILTSLNTKFRDQVKPLTKLYTLHKTLNSARERKEKEERKTKPMEQTPTQSLYIAVHSLVLHLKSALSRVENIEEELEKLSESQNQNHESGDSVSLSAAPDDNLLTRCSSILKVVRSDLSACQDCVEEGEIRVEKLGPRSNQQTNAAQPYVNEPSVDGSTKPTTAPVPLFDIGDPVVVDEVFQAYTDDVELETSTLDADSLLSDEEREKKKQEKREAVRLLKELKTVIAIRAEETEERERQALLKKYPEAKFENPMLALRKQPTQIPEDEEVDSEKEEIRDNLEGEQSISRTLASEVEDAVPQSTELPQFRKDLTFDENLRNKLAGLGGTNFPFSMDLASQAAARSHQMAAYSEDTFGDDDSQDELSDAAVDDEENHGTREVKTNN